MYDNNTPVINPNKFISYLKETGRLKHPTAPETIIFIFLDHLIPLCADKHHLTKIDGFDAGQLYQFVNDPSIGLFCCGGIGAPVAVINMEELIAFGAKNFIIVGTAGSLQNDLNIGDIVMCSEAIIDEGTSKHYDAEHTSIQPSPDWHEQLRRFLESHHLNPKIGTSWTTDAPYRETKKKVLEFQDQGVLTVEMEISALFTLARFYKVNISSLFTISDSLADLNWDPGFFSEKVTESLILLIDNAMAFAKNHKGLQK